MRIDDVLVSYTTTKKSEVKKIIKQNRVLVDGIPINLINHQVDSNINEVKLDGQLVQFPAHRYLMLNKAIRTLSANQDASLPVVFDALSSDINREGLYIIGRLDFLSEGLILITDNGKLGRKLLEPEAHVEKAYEVVTKEPLSETAVAEFASGLVIDGTIRLAPAKLVVTSEHTANITIGEGKNRQIRKMFLSIGVLVTKLVRTEIGPIKLDEQLASGDYRALTKSEIKALSRYFN
ncbi:MAG: pseudouridine synthase [Lactococcus sp.]|nr:pseudouridine synthase [Lactococcus sp.]SOB46841.1 Pseudouridine synthase [Lactococcus piscium]MDN5404022.1 pseudouridine synthase [Lactococcus sp.]MDN5410058.1 pseudouridine synthase [Lactococcus sp.]MDN5411894.1 pseudouridine synthase [Lactococcus sp.]MDN5436027.1 pseudouridine synthase [Lactococcus sp.]